MFNTVLYSLIQKIYQKKLTDFGECINHISLIVFKINSEIQKCCDLTIEGS